jgi:hypothetical protein
VADRVHIAIDIPGRLRRVMSRDDREGSGTTLATSKGRADTEIRRGLIKPVGRVEPNEALGCAPLRSTRP